MATKAHTAGKREVCILLEYLLVLWNFIPGQTPFPAFCERAVILTNPLPSLEADAPWYWHLVAIAAVGTHPTGMHSCCILKLPDQKFVVFVNFDGSRWRLCNTHYLLFEKYASYSRRDCRADQSVSAKCMKWVLTLNKKPLKQKPHLHLFTNSQC